ncbi:MAG: helix-turn-helix domain-containing protein [Rubrivivax sp.]
MPPSSANAPAAPRRRPLARLPSFALYGEGGALAQALHVESIDSRSRLYDWEIDAHVHRGLHQILWLHAGRVEALLDESRIRCAGPAALAIPPGVAHAFRFSRPADGFVLTFNAARLAEGDAAAVADALQRVFAQPHGLAFDGSPAAAAEAARLHTLFGALHAESRAHDSDAGDGPVPLWLTRAIVWRLAQHTRREAGAGRHRAAGRHSFYTRWLALLEAHHREHWPVSRYARQLGLSAERLNRIVRAETGNSVQQMIHARLAREASRWLVHVAAPVSKLAFELGFDDPAYFCRFFKRHTGLTPREYRARAQRD